MGRGPTIQEIAEATGLTSEEIYDTFEVGNYGRPLSLDAEHNANGNQDLYSLLDYLGGDDPQFDLVSDRIDLSNTFSCLDQREKTIIHLKFYTGLSQTEIAKRLGISQMHVSRLQRNGPGQAQTAPDKVAQRLRSVAFREVTPASLFAAPHSA